METDASKLDLPAALRVARRYAPLVLLCVVIATASALVASETKRRQYTATAQVLFRSQQLDQQAAGLPSVNISDPQAQTDTNLKLASLPEVVTQTAAALGRPFTPDRVASNVSVSQVGDTELASVAATWTSPETAARLANTYAQEIVATRQRANTAYYASALRSVNLQLKRLTPSQQYGTQAAVLRDRQSSLETLAQLQSADVQVQQVATPPTGPSSPKILRNTAIGGFLGLLLGAGIAFLLHRFDRRLREPKDLEQIFGVPLIGVIPESRALRATRGGEGARAPLPHREAEIFGLLRAHIRYFNVDRELRVIVVVSAGAGEGKTTVARNLAVTSAMVGSRVLLVEADLRRPTIAEQLGVGLRPGLAEALLDGEPLADTVQHVELPTPGGTSLALDVLAAGGVLPPNPPQVIESRSMKSLLEQARQKYDLVVIDTPPLLLVPDAFPLLAESDGVLIVSRLGRNGKDMATRLRDSLQGADAPVLGVVANGVGRSHESYGYDADYASQRTEIPDAEPEAPDAEPTADPQPAAPATEPILSAESNGHDADIGHDWIDFPVPVPAHNGNNGYHAEEPPAAVEIPVPAPVPAYHNGSNGHNPGRERSQFGGARGSIPPPGMARPAEVVTETHADSRGIARMLGLHGRRSAR